MMNYSESDKYQQIRQLIYGYLCDYSLPKIACLSSCAPNKNDKEYHHFPITRLNGGKTVIPLCITRHNHIDRLTFDTLTIEYFNDLIITDNLTRAQKIFFMKAVKILNAVYAQHKRKEDKLNQKGSK